MKHSKLMNCDRNQSGITHRTDILKSRKGIVYYADSFTVLSNAFCSFLCSNRSGTILAVPDVSISWRKIPSGKGNNLHVWVYMVIKDRYVLKSIHVTIHNIECTKDCHKTIDQTTMLPAIACTLSQMVQEVLVSYRMCQHSCLVKQTVWIGKDNLLPISGCSVSILLFTFLAHSRMPVVSKVPSLSVCGVAQCVVTFANLRLGTFMVDSSFNNNTITVNCTTITRHFEQTHVSAAVPFQLWFRKDNNFYLAFFFSCFILLCCYHGSTRKKFGISAVFNNAVYHCWSEREKKT